MKKLLLSLSILFCLSAHAQTVLQANFTFGPGTPPCAAITSWNGVANAYPNEMGNVCFNQGGEWLGSSIDVPWQLGFLNNGYLPGCGAIAWGQKTFTVGNGTHSGDAFTQAASAVCESSDNQVVSFSVVATFQVTARCNYVRGRCYSYLSNVLQGGTGVIQQTLIP